MQTNITGLTTVMKSHRAQGRLLLVAGLLLLTACGGSSSNSSQNNSSSTTPPNGVSGNWQFTMGTPTDNSFVGGLQGGFLLQQQNTAVTGAAVYTIQSPATQAGGAPTVCNSGSASITGTVTGQNVSLTAVAGPQTFNLSGGLSSDGLTMMGTYTATDGKGCGNAETGLHWSAVYVPNLTGAIQGNFHSVISPKVQDQDFPVTGSLTQGENIGANSATIRGTLNFEGYPCLSSASVNGQVSGNSLILQIIAPSGATVGQIGASSGNTNPSPVTVLSSTAGTVIQGTNGYGVSTSACPGGNVPGDVGNICLAVGNATACTQPFTLSPASLSFPIQPIVQQAGVLPPVAVQVGSAPTTQTITLTNTGLSGTPLNGLSLTFNPQSGAPSAFGVSDFDGLPNYTEQDNCSGTPGATFSLAPQQFCTITISFSPQQSCPWLPSTGLGGVNPASCPYPLTASLIVNSPTSADNLTAFAVPISGLGFSAVTPSTPELDFGAEAVGETSASQQLSFTNEGNNPVQILPAVNTPCVNPTVGVLTMPRPPAAGVVPGLQVDASISPNGSTIDYLCDSDLTSKLPNFRISNDNCSGMLLMPQASCTLQIAFSPQPSTPLAPSLDYFLQLNTTQCNSITSTNCEIDSGRFPVELTANLPSTLRMTPGAGLDFGVQTRGAQGDPLTITLYNDPKDPKPATVNFTGNLVKGDYMETDNCGASLVPGATCIMTVLFQPKIVGFDPGTLTITYFSATASGQTQTIHLRGTGQ